MDTCLKKEIIISFKVTLWWDKEEEGKWYQIMDSNIKGLLNTINLMALELLKLRMEFTVDSLEMDWKTDKGNLNGMMDHIIKEILKMIKEKEKDFLNLNKVALKDNGEMMKYKVQVILLLVIMVLEDNGVKTITQNLINFSDIKIF